MKFSYIVFVVLLLSCGTDEIGQEKFPYPAVDSFESPWQFDGDKEAHKVTETELLALFQDPIGEAFGPYYYSWISKETDGSNYFTLAYADDCQMGIYLVKDQGSEMSLIGTLALQTSCSDSEVEKSTKIDGKEFISTSVTYDVVSIYPSKEIVKSEINDGVFTEITKYQEHPGVSLWNGLALRETPEKKGKYITRVNMGEIFSITDLQIDAAADDYVEIQLKSGQRGFILSDLVYPKCVPGTLTDEASILRRPDLLTKTAENFNPLDIVGITELKMVNGETWMKVKGKPRGEKWFKEGWVSAYDISRDAIDLAIAAYASRAFELADYAEQEQAIKDIIQNDDLNESLLIAYLEEMIR